jgi:hypothetical protein
VNIISADVGWKETTKRNAVAIARPPGKICFIDSGLGNRDLISLVQEYAEPESRILLDVPIEGCENRREPFRPVESALQHYISLYPAKMADKRGIELKQTLLQAMPEGIRESIIIQEIYPHAIYKFLWVARRRGQLERVRSGVWERLLDGGFTPRVSPPRYKGSIARDKRLTGMQELHNLLTEHLGLSFSQPIGPPGDTLSRSRLDLLADELDACLGAVVGLGHVAHSPYAWVAGDQSRGEILLLADIWLKEQLEKEGVKMSH